MPCPYFAPERIAPAPKHPTARLPLLDEYEGVCHAGERPETSPPEVQFRLCNHGYSAGECARHPGIETHSAARISVLSETASVLEVVYVEERAYAPVRWQHVRFLRDDERLEPEQNDVCARAQLIAFCRSYVRRVPK